MAHSMNTTVALVAALALLCNAKDIGQGSSDPHFMGSIPSGQGMLRNPACDKCLIAWDIGAVVLSDCDASDPSNLWAFGKNGTIWSPASQLCIRLFGDVWPPISIILDDCFSSHTGKPSSMSVWSFNDDKTIRSHEFGKCISTIMCDADTQLIQNDCYHRDTGLLQNESLWEWVPAAPGTKASVLV